MDFTHFSFLEHLPAAAAWLAICANILFYALWIGNCLFLSDRDQTRNFRHFMTYYMSIIHPGKVHFKQDWYTAKIHMSSETKFTKSGEKKQII